MSKCQANRVSSVLPRHSTQRRSWWTCQLVQSEVLNYTQSPKQPMHEMGAHLFLLQWMFFTQCLSSAKGLTMKCGTLEENAAESRMMAKGCMVVILCRRSQNCLTYFYKCYQALAWSLYGFGPSSSDGPPKSWCIWIILALAAMISVIANSWFPHLWPSL